MTKSSINPHSISLGRKYALRRAVMVAFCDPLPPEFFTLLAVSDREWRSLLHWLDTSGLALYFLNRLQQFKQTNILPQHVHTRLNRNLEDNMCRTHELVTEAQAIQSGFTQVGLLFAVLKGFSLWPDSVSRCELRSQLDLDFLIYEEDAGRARELLESRGYKLMAISGRTLEFKAEGEINASMKTLYTAGCAHCVELHLEAKETGGVSLLQRVVQRQLCGVWMPVVPPLDQFIGQAMHLYKHLCSEFTRAAHILEFRRHVIARFEDDAFWHELKSSLQSQPDVCLRLGVILQLISHVMGDFAPSALTSYTVCRIPPLALLWIDCYAVESALASFPGSKLYLLLEQALVTAGIPSKRPLRNALLPGRLPTFNYPASASESLRQRSSRLNHRFHFICFRLRFHVFEGFRFYRESLRFQQQRDGCVR